MPPSPSRPNVDWSDEQEGRGSGLPDVTTSQGHPRSSRAARTRRLSAGERAAKARRAAAAMLRLNAGRDPLNEALTALIGELATRSPQFRQDWARQEVHEHRCGEMTFNHPHLGPIRVSFDGFAMPGEKGLSIITYSAEEGTVDADRLHLLPLWAESEHAEAWTC
nr:hypothetical protein [Nocardia coubleae]